MNVVNVNKLLFLQMGPLQFTPAFFGGLCATIHKFFLPASFQKRNRFQVSRFLQDLEKVLG